jgi:hypothetical protein
MLFQELAMNLSRLILDPLLMNRAGDLSADPVFSHAFILLDSGGRERTGPSLGKLKTRTEDSWTRLGRTPVNIL